MSPEETIDALRLRIAQRNDPSTLSDEWIEYLAVTLLEGCFHLSFHGDPSGESCQDLMDTLCDPQIAVRIRSLALAGPDIGANGTKNWNIEPLLAGSAAFSALESFSIRLEQPEDHNRTIIGEMYDESGVVAKLLERSPRLRSLVIPSAPDDAFFSVKQNCIEYFSVDAGYDTQNLISNLGRFHSLPRLRSFAWGEYNQTYMENWQQNVTPFQDYRLLVRSPQFEHVRTFVWRNPACSDDDIQEIVSLRQDLGILVVKYSSNWQRRGRLVPTPSAPNG
jgi:hypothetical protein